MQVGDLIRHKWQGGSNQVYIVLQVPTNAYVNIINESGQRVSVPKRHYELVSRTIPHHLRKSLNKS